MRTFTFLGTGTSTGVPTLGCDCAVCQSTDPRNNRWRCAAVIGTPKGNILIDTPPELRLQLLRAKIDRIHSVLYTHYHADHLFGMDDLRQFPRFLGTPMPTWCTDDVEEVLRFTFPYVFATTHSVDPAYNYLPKLDIRRIKPGEEFHVLGERVIPIPLVHAQFRVMGFRMGDLAYCTDVNRIPDMSRTMLKDLKILIIDALRYRPHPAHLGLSESLEIIAELKPQRAFLTHISHDLDFETVSRELPPNVEMAVDGMTLEF